MLTVGGRRIIDRVASALAQVVDDTILVSNADDAPSWLPGARVVRDVRSERGSIVGIHTALTHASDRAVVVAWDMPFVSADLLRHMLDLSSNSMAVIPVGPRGPEPFCAVYDRRLLPALDSMIDGGQLRVRDLIEQISDAVTIPDRDVAHFGDPSRLFFNVNTADDLARAEVMAREE